MAMTQPALIGLGAFATLASIGMFLEYGDKATRPFIGMVASVAWGFVSLSSFNITIVDGGVTYEVALTPIVWFAGGLAIVTFLFTLRLLLYGVKEEAESANFDAFR